tara:strand:+ start:286 stop:1371 length:1086 start_codon:yes stop_codon:yes gene_type:complete
MTKAAELAKMGEVLTNSKVSGRRNLVINGAMQVAQRGTSATIAGIGTVDRFSFPFDGSNTITQSQGTLSSSDSPYADGFRHYARNTNTNTSSGTGTYAGIKTIIESQDMAQSGWEYTSTSSTVTIQFWARSSIAGTYYMNLRSDDTTAQNFTIPVTLTADTWKKITATVIGNSGLVFNNDNGAGLSIIMWMHLGTNYTTSDHTLNAWQVSSGSNQALDYSIDWRNTSGATFDLTGIQLEVGSVATPFEHRSFGEELLLCQRYFQLISGGAVMPNSSTGIEGSVTRQEMRAATSISVTAAMKVEDPSVTTYTQSSASATISNSDKFAEKFTLQNFSGLNTHRPYFLKNPQDGGGQIELDAEL